MAAYQCPLDNLLIVDFATTSENNNYDYPPEIIQFSVSVLDVKNKRIREDVSFNEYCKPAIYKTLSAHCIETTGVSQEQVDSARSFKDVYDDFVSWLKENNFEEKKFAFVCHTDETIWKYAQYQFLLNETALPRIFRQWFDVSFYYLKGTQQLTTLAPQNNLVRMAAYYGAALEGERFDSRTNTISLARIVQKMLDAGLRININSHLSCIDKDRNSVGYWDKSIAWQTDRALFFKFEQHILPLMFTKQLAPFDLNHIGFCAYCRSPSELCTGLKHKQYPHELYKALKHTSRQISMFAEYLPLSE